MLTMFIVFHLQRYCYFMTLAIGFEDCFDDLKNVNKFKRCWRRTMRAMRAIAILQLANFFSLQFFILYIIYI